MKIKKAIIPVAGLGTRFIPATKAMAKEMLTIVDKPVIQYAVEEALEAGIEQIIFVTKKDKHILEDHFDRSYEIESWLKNKGKDYLLKKIKEVVPKPGTIIYTRQHHALGLGHAVWCARDIIGREPFAVILPDDLIQAEKPVLSEMMRKFYQLKASIIAIMEVKKRETNKYGIIDPGKKEQDMVSINDMVEKPDTEHAPSNLAIIGRYILTPEIFDFLERGKKDAGGEIQLTHAMKALLKEQEIFGYMFKGRRFDCGDKAGFIIANLAFGLQRPGIKEELMDFIKKI